MSQFPHLALPNRLIGLHKPKPGRSKDVDPHTQSNRDSRTRHGELLMSSVNNLSDDWTEKIEQRQNQGFPDLPNPEIVPVFLQVDPSKFDIESLKSFGIEIIAEEDAGFIIGASSADFRSLKSKIKSFIAEHGTFKNKASELWGINEGTQWRIEQILSEELSAKWNQIADNQEVTVDVGIACYLKVSKQPIKMITESEQVYIDRIARWNLRRDDKHQEREKIAIQRQSDFQTLIENYSGEIGSFVDYEDSFACRITVTGKALKDLVLNYQFLFEVIECDSLVLPDGSSQESSPVNLNPLPPLSGAPKVCVIDSGIEEGHRLLAPAIDSISSHSFIDGDDSTADIAAGGGHGTKVAGAVLYPHEIPVEGDYRLPFYIQNARVLMVVGGRTVLPVYLYPPKLMEDIVNQFDGTRIFNMSINSFTACRKVHMSQWASSIDKIMFEKDVLFVLSAGNIPTHGDEQRPGIVDHINLGRNYPAFLLEASSRIGNPAQSSFALTVGSVCISKFEDDLRESFGTKDSPSSFSRTGLGLWGMVKPDVVEYAGDFVREKGARPNITNVDSVSPKLIRSTRNGGSEVGSDRVGTSFAAPKVTRIAAALQDLYPNEPANMYRALIAQSARLPEAAFLSPSLNHIQHFGYGIPDFQRATENSEQRITLITTDKVQARNATVYTIKIPPEMRAPGEDHDILIEVTLAYMSRIRRTRRGSQSYLSTWLDWHSSKLNEDLEQFKRRVLKNIDDSEEIEALGQDTIPWVIREKKDWSKIKGLKRQDSTLQKSWCVLKAHQLPEAFSVAVIGHPGWEPDNSEEVDYSLNVSFEALSAGVEVYEMIRIENEIELPTEIEVEN